MHEMMKPQRFARTDLVRKVTIENMDSFYTSGRPFLLAFLTPDDNTSKIRRVLSGVAQQLKDKLDVGVVSKDCYPVLSNVYGITGSPVIVLIDARGKQKGQLLGNVKKVELITLVLRSLP